MLRYLSILSVLLLTCSGLKAQPPPVNTDSLLKISNNDRLPDSIRLGSLELIVSDWMMRDPDSCLHYTRIFASLATRLKSEEHLATALYLQGVSYYFKGELSEAIHSLNKSLEHRGEHGDPIGTAAALNVIGAVYMKQGNHAKAIDHYVRCLKLSERIEDSRGIAGSHFNIGRIYTHQKDYEKALTHFKTSLLYKDSSDLAGKANVYQIMATTYVDMKRDLLAQVYFQKSLAFGKAAGDITGVGISYSNMASYYLDRENPDTVILYAQKSIAQFEQVDDWLGIAYAYATLAQANKLKGQPRKAIEWAEKAMDIARQFNETKLVQETARILSDNYRSIGQLDKALEMYDLNITLKDSIQSEENQRGVLRQEYAYQYEKEALSDSLQFAKKEAVLTEQTEKQRLGLGAAAIVLLLIILLASSIYKGKKRSDELLLNILPEQVAEELKQHGQAEARLINEVTVLFTDFKDFTAVSEKMTPKELVHDLHECFTAFDHIIQKHGLEKIKTIGDAYMAAGGLPTPNQTHPRDAVSAALDIIDFIEGIKVRKIADGKPYFDIRIGIHTGPVVAGIVGVKKFSYDIWGDTVNTASRIESSGSAGQVNISQTTYELLQDDPQFAFESRGMIETKGKGAMEMYFVAKI
ncbi:MAG: tetratricopeptide repeat protein [Saprospiraceae bacterium]|nr:tetratricopeptide repeat protein [Saprospiraceae bacterium]